MEQPDKSFYSIEEYMKLEEQEDHRYEYHDGEVFAMAGAAQDSGDPKHSAIAANLLRLLGNHLYGKGCRPYTSDLKIYIEKLNRFLYPDVSVFCGDRIRSEKDKKSYVNPVMITEIVSPSTVNYDAQEKFWFYSQLPTLGEYILVSQDREAVQVFFREDFQQKWQMEWIVGKQAVVNLQSIKTELALEEIYFDVD
jgi:Uma2 family endonuclease